MVLDLKLPDMSGFEVLEQMRDDSRLADTPVVVFTGRELTAEEDAQLHTMARSVVVKGVESRPNGCSTRRRSSCTGWSPTCPSDKQEMLERLHSSDDDLVEPHRAAGRRRRTQHLRPVELFWSGAG